MYQERGVIGLLSVYVDLALGLVTSFLLLSLLVSGLNEGFVRLLSIRSKFLWAYLRDTMDGAAPSGHSWLPSRVSDVFAKLPFSEDPRPAHNEQPSPSEVAPVPEREGALTGLFYQRVREIDYSRRGRTSISDIPPERFSVAMMEMASAEKGGVEGLLAKLQAVGSPLHGHLQGLWEGSQRDLNRFRQGVESWFDAEMQRLSMLYRRYVKWVVAVLGFVVVLLFSMDGLEYAKTLLRDNAYRSAVSAIAGGDTERLEPLREECATPGNPYRCVTETLSSPALVKVFDHAIVSVVIPEEGDPSLSWNGGVWWERLITLSHWPGFLVTYLALLFGAPFWWDVLRRITGLRSTK